MKNVLMFMFMLACPMVMTAQNNLVKNPGFESLRTRPNKVGELHKAEYWSSPTSGTADLFHQHAKSEEVMVPKNNLGYQEPHDGEGYAGAIFYSRRDDQREYLMGELTEPLETGEIYCVSFYVSSADLGKYAINQIGVYFSGERIRVNNWDPLPVRAYFTNPELRMLPKQDKWQIVCGQFEANGGETFIVIGNFAQKDEVKIERQRKPRGISGVPQEYGYYYIDDVSVVHIDDMDGDCGCEDKIAEENAGMKVVYSKVVGDGTENDMTPAEMLESKSIYFATSSAEILPQSHTDLDAIIKMLVTKGDIKLEIMGYADADELSKDAGLPDKRANAILAQLVKGGIKAERLKVVRGNPNVSKSAVDADAKTRVHRVDFIVVSD